MGVLSVTGGFYRCARRIATWVLEGVEGNKDVIWGVFGWLCCEYEIVSCCVSCRIKGGKPWRKLYMTCLSVCVVCRARVALFIHVGAFCLKTRKQRGIPWRVIDNVCVQLCVCPPWWKWLSGKGLLVSAGAQYVVVCCLENREGSENTVLCLPCLFYISSCLFVQRIRDSLKLFSQWCEEEVIVFMHPECQVFNQILVF